MAWVCLRAHRGCAAVCCAVVGAAQPPSATHSLGPRRCSAAVYRRQAQRPARCHLSDARRSFVLAHLARLLQGYTILNHDDHKNFLRKHKRDATEYRPDILHQALLAILDSPLNKAGKVRAVYVSTRSNVLFEVSTKTKVRHRRLPRASKKGV